MPLIQIKVIEGALSQEQKEEMIARVSQVASEIEARPHSNEHLLKHTICVIEEVKSGSYGAGGQAATLEALQMAIEGKL